MTAVAGMTPAERDALVLEHLLEHRILSAVELLERWIIWDQYLRWEEEPPIRTPIRVPADYAPPTLVAETTFADLEAKVAKLKSTVKDRMTAEFGKTMGNGS